MSKLIKHLKPFRMSVFVIVVLLLIQASTDLVLPDYTSNIVNVGIQQGGIEDAVPEIISKSEFDKLIIFMDSDEKLVVLKNYKLLNRNNQSRSDYNYYLKKYPKATQEPVYVLNTKDKEIREELNSIMGRSILAVLNTKKNGLKGLTQAMPDGMLIPAGADTFDIIKSMPKEQLDMMKTKMNEKLSDMPESMITQGATSYIKDEYSSLGVNTKRMQSNYILYSGGVMLLIALVGMIASVAVGFIAARVSAKLGTNLRKNVFRKVSNFSNLELDKFSTASLITRSTNDIQQIQTLMVMLLRIVFYAPILGVGGVIKIYNSDSSMSWILAVAVAGIISLVAVLFGVAIPKFKIIQKLVDKVNLVTREILTGTLVIRAFSTQKYEREKFDKANKELTKTNLFTSRVMVTMMPLMMLIMNGTTLLIVWIGSQQIDNGVMQVGNMMAFIQYAMQVIMSFLMITMVSVILPRASVAAQRVDEILETELTIKNSKNPQKFDNSNKGVIEFKNVGFKYPGAEGNVLCDINFTAKPGQTTAFIGSTGSGKTTLVNLIPRFYDVTEGEILIDNINIRDIEQHDLREQIGYVPQKGILFSGTIESNLSYGVESVTNKELEKSAEIAQATEFISQKPEGFEAPIAQGGSNVSGGQKQRLSIARALTKKPKIYIFDDSFSALDFKTDAALRKALKGETENSTVLIVAQRVSTIMNADQIIVLDEGKIVGIGKHKELLENCEVYNQIALSQLSKEELA